jgi:CRP-like cAMP-binding protein
LKEEYINTIPLFANLSSKEHRAILKEIKVEKYRHNEIIFTKDSESDVLYIVEEGRINLSADGKITLANVGPGSLLGETEFFQGIPHPLTARAASDVIVSVLEDTSLRTLIRNNPQLGLSLSQALDLPLVQMTDYLAEQLVGVSSMHGLSVYQRKLIASRLVAQVFEPDQAIFRSDDSPAGIFLIEEGLVRLIGDVDEDYTELGSGEILGEMATLSGKNHAQTAQTAQETVVWRLSPEDFNEIAQSHPEIRAALSQTVTARLSKADQAHAAEVLKRIPLFSQLPPKAREDAASYLMLRHVPADQIIFNVGDHGDAIFIVESGEVALRNSQGGLTGRTLEGDFFGEMALMTGKSRTEIATAVTDTNLWAMYRPDFDSLLVKHPQLSTALSQSLRERLSAADSQFIEKHLKKLAVMGGLSRLQLDEISARLHARRFNTGDIIYHEGQPGNELYFIENGQVERFASTPHGTVALPVLGSGDFVGETALLSGRLHATTVRAQTDVDIWILSKADFDELIYKYPNLSAILSRTMSDRVVETMEFIRGAQAQPRPAIPAYASATGGVSGQRRQTTGSAPPVPLRPVAPPPPPFSRPSRPVSKPVVTGQPAQRASRPVAPPKSSKEVKPVSRPVQANARSQSRPAAAAKSQSRPAAKANSRPVSKPQPKRRTSKSVRQQSRARQRGPAGSVARGAGRVGAAVQRRIDGLSEWYASVPLGTRLGLAVVFLLLIWMCGIAAPASIINALAATIFGEETELLVEDNGAATNNIVGGLSQSGLVAALPFVETTTPTPTSTGTPTPTPTASATVTQTPIPSFTPTPTNTPTPVDTPTPTPTPEPTDTPTPTSIPPTNTPAYRAPTNTPTPEPTPTPDVDFLVKKVRKLTPCENEGNHHIYIRVVDPNGIGINNIPVKITWGRNDNDFVIAKTEAKDKGDGFVEFAMFKGTYSVEIAGAKTQVASGITPDYQVDELCPATGNSVANSLYHASFEVVFQRTY